MNVTKIYALGSAKILFDELERSFGAQSISQTYCRDHHVVTSYPVNHGVIGTKLFTSSTFMHEGNRIIVDYNNEVVGTCFTNAGFRELQEVDLGEKI